MCKEIKDESCLEFATQDQVKRSIKTKKAEMNKSYVHVSTYPELHLSRTLAGNSG